MALPRPFALNHLLVPDSMVSAKPADPHTLTHAPLERPYRSITAGWGPVTAGLRSRCHLPRFDRLRNSAAPRTTSTRHTDIGGRQEGFEGGLWGKAVATNDRNAEFLIS